MTAKKTATFGPVLLTLAILVFLGGCRSPHMGGEPTGNISAITSFRMALAGLDSRDQKRLFNDMVPELRLELWQDRLQTAIKETQSRAQQASIQAISELLSVEMYANSNRSTSGPINPALAEAIDAAYRAFESDPEPLARVLTTLGDAGAAAVIVPAAVPACTCASANNGNLRGNDCGALSRNCRVGGCALTRFGCGHLWLQRCDGRCLSIAPGK